MRVLSGKSRIGCVLIFTELVISSFTTVAQSMVRLKWKIHVDEYTPLTLIIFPVICLNSHYLCFLLCLHIFTNFLLKTLIWLDTSPAELFNFVFIRGLLYMGFYNPLCGLTQSVFTTTLSGRYFYHSYFIEEKNGGQRNEVTCRRSPSRWVVAFRFGSKQSGSRVCSHKVRGFTWTQSLL